MKTDRFVKAMLVIIAGLLFLNCIDNGSVISPTKASTPAFLQVGKTYNCSGVGAGYEYTIISTDKESGWIRAKAKSNGIQPDSESWVNTSLLNHCSEK